MTDNLKRTNNEIDLIDLFSNLWKGIVKLAKAILNLILFLLVFGIKQVQWLLIMAVLGCGIGYIVYKQTDRYFSSEMIAQPNGFTSIDMAQYVNDVHAICMSKDTELLAEALEISPESAAVIKDIQAFFYIDVNLDGVGDYVDYEFSYSPTDSTVQIISSRILIRAEVYDNIGFNDVREGLTSYINRHPYLTTVNKLKKQELESKITMAKGEIQRLDSLQMLEYFEDREGGRIDAEGQIVFLAEKPRKLYHHEKITLLAQQINFEQTLELSTDPITILKNFTPLKIEENPLILYLVQYAFLMVLVMYVFLMYFIHRKKINSYLITKA